ncbi:MAG TPA: hypothetical protein DDW23_04950 [Planctomycetes bacterium]|nr:hypothetical protein [Planctomycetota bacterium]|tara:strand:- start:23 stop:748 length:726 start_codon:yes stop_codon:yes gene_type:complete
MKVRAFLIFLCSATPLFAQSAFLGVELAPPILEIEGAVVSRVEVPSAASIMGVLADDVILTLDDVEISSNASLLEALSRRLPGDIATITVLRAGTEFELLGLLGRRPGDLGGLRPRLENLESQRDGFAWPEMPDIAWPEMPDIAWPEMPDIAWPEIPHFDSLFGPEGLEFSFDWGGQNLDGAKVRVTYPESTPENEREALILEAREKYGEGVDIEFVGPGHSISIQKGRSFGRKEEDEEDI